MKTNFNIYLAFDCQILLSGFELLIQSHVNLPANIKKFHSATEVLAFDFSQGANEQNILLFDCSLANDFTNSQLIQFFKKFPHLMTMIMVEEFKHEKIKFLYSIGVKSVLDRNIKANEFLEMFDQTINGEKSLSPEFKTLVLEDFCETLNNYPSTKSLSLNEYESKKKDYYNQLFGLTKREKEILSLISEGKNTKDISQELFISLHTVETHRRNLLEKLDVRNTAEMVKVAMMNNLILVGAY